MISFSNASGNEFPKVIITWGDADGDESAYYMVALYVDAGVCEPDFVTVDVASELENFYAREPIAELCADAGIDSSDVTIEWDL